MHSLLFLILTIYVLYKIFGRSLNAYEQQNDWSGQQQANAREVFIGALLQLLAVIMRADGKVVKSELDYVKETLKNMIGLEDTKRAVLRLRDLLETQINLDAVTHTIRRQLDINSRLQILSMLYGLAMADGQLSAAEWQLLQRICLGLGLSLNDLSQIQNMYNYSGGYGYGRGNGGGYSQGGSYGGGARGGGSQAQTQQGPSLAQAYKLLGLNEGCSDGEVKKAYREMAKKYHPDRVANLGKDIQEDAQKKFVKIQEAYEKITAARGMK